MGNHGPAKKLWDDTTHIFQSFNPRRLLFFVHGFGGQNTAAWPNFPSLLIGDPTYAGDDLLFYGYESRRQSASTSADLLFQHCDEFLNHPDRFKTEFGFQRPADFAYDHIVFVAHSLGAPVVRSMILRAVEARFPWVKKRH